jgi:rhamnosyltransferase subunit B
MSRRIVLAAFGSYGDVNPFLGIARELRERGHEPVIASHGVWKTHVESAGFEFRQVGFGFDESVETAGLNEWLAAGGVFDSFRASYDELLSAADGADALVALTLVLAGPLVARKTGIPWVSVVLEPLSFFSAYEPLLLPFGMSLPELKVAARHLAEPIYRLRAELGLPPGSDPFYSEYLTADAVLALFSPLVSAPQPDWPPQAVVTGFVNYDRFTASGPALDKLREFLSAGPPPVVFTLSSDLVFVPFNNFYTESLLAAKMLGRRAVMLGLNMPETLSPDVLTLSHVPFSEVFPHAAAVVHHGGIGTSAIALKAGRPMLLLPGSRAAVLSYAQPDIAARFERLGVARVLRREQYNAVTVASELRTLLSDPSYAIRASVIGRRVAAEDGSRVACDVIERVMGGAGRPQTVAASGRGRPPKANGASVPTQAAQADAYLNLLKRALTGFRFGLKEHLMMAALRDMDSALIHALAEWGMAALSPLDGDLSFNPLLRSLGMDYPPDAETMIGLHRLDNLERCIVSVLRRDVPGDLAETGVWRGGAAIFMRAVLKAYGDAGRKVWLADSFRGFPRPDAVNYPADRGNNLWAFPQLAVPLETVKDNFARYGLLDERVRFLAGWFGDTLPAAPIDRLAVLRLDGGMYESTIVALRSLYHRVSPGGFVIVDDYCGVPACRQAVDDFRAEQDVVAPLCPIDWTGVYWQANSPGRGGKKQSVADRKRAAGHGRR